MFRYRAYGLDVESPFALPELTELATGAPAGEGSVVIRLGQVDRTPAAGCWGGEGAWASRESACFDFAGAGVYAIREGREIVIDPAIPLDARDADVRVHRLILLGPAMAVLLHQRGLLVLHASAVALRTPAGPRAVAFLGDKGAGKSTTAAALHARGHPLVSDDVVALDPSGGTPSVLPGFPHLKLFPESAASTLDAPGVARDLPRVRPDVDKRSRPARDGFSSSRLPMAALYALEDGDADAIVPTSPREAFLHLLRHSYLARLLHATGGDADHFRQATAVVRGAAVRRLVRRRDLGNLAALARRIEDDAVSIAPGEALQQK